jgi:hypothetical protein
MSFYVTLPSNVTNSTGQQDNKTSEYLTVFPDSLVLEGPYEVALSEIIYYQNWKFKLCDVFIHRNDYERHYEIYTYDGENDMEKLFKIINKKLKLFCDDFKTHLFSHYKNEILDSIGRTAAGAPKDPFLFGEKVSYFETELYSERFSIEAVIGVNSITFNVSEPLLVQFVEAINSLYSFETIRNNYLLDQKYHKKNSTIYNSSSTEPMELFYEALHGIHSIFIYSDVIDTQIVGDSRTRLLRVINVSSKYKEVVSRVYENPDYLPVSSREINSIKIILRDDTGQKIFFTNSKVIVKLHFRKKRYF